MRIPMRFFLAPAVVLGSLAAHADAPPAAQFEGALDVRAVNVEAVVTDRHGQRVQGLKAEDFVLRVDGKEVPIDFFSEVREGETVQSSMEVETAAPGRPAAEAAPTPATVNYLVFIDESFLIAAQRDFVVRRVQKDLRRMGPADRMAIVSYDGRRLTRLADWTMDRGAIDSAFQAAMLRPAQGIVRQAARMVEFNFGQSDRADKVATRGISGNGTPAAGETVRYEAKVVLPKGDHHLVFILRDEAGEGEAWGALDVKAAVRR